MRCSCCEEEFENADDGRENDAGSWYCDDCYDNRYGQCRTCQGEVVCDDVFCDDGAYYCDDCVDTHYFVCAHCGNRENNDYGTTIRNGDRVCESCYRQYYSHCVCCDEVVPDGDWCNSCDSCTDCCRCDYCSDCDEHNDNCTCCYCDDCGNNEDECTCEEPAIIVRAGQRPPPVPVTPSINVSPFRDSGGNAVALIERLDNSKFELLPSNVTKVLDMLDKDGTLRASGIMGRPCTGDSGYYLITDILHDVGKVANPRYVYGVRSNEYDVVISSESLNHDISRKLIALGLTYTYVASSKMRVGLSFKVRKRKYRKCIEFLKFYCDM